VFGDELAVGFEVGTEADVGAGVTKCVGAGVGLFGVGFGVGLVVVVRVKAKVAVSVWADTTVLKLTVWPKDAVTATEPVSVLMLAM
jgi:hypothetical protein